MSVSTDTFARFVNLLADTLDDHQAAGDALAARLHMSRFHFDRLVSAAGGEPPGALRRRVLLERAAYQLITSDREVLEIAMDAGYSSNEAFTRAFARALRRAAVALAAAPGRSSRSARRTTCTSTHPGACASPPRGR